jgi:hypothetical protein
LQYEKIHIDEEKNNLIWYLIIAVAVAIAAFWLIDAFIVSNGRIIFYRLVPALVLIAIAAYGIVNVTKPLYHFDLFIKESALIIDIYKGDDEHLDRQELPLSEINELRIAPHTPRLENDALFDFTTNYYLLYQNNQGDYERLIYPGEKLFSFKVKDIRKIIGFLSTRDETIYIPPDQELFMEKFSG